MNLPEKLKIKFFSVRWNDFKMVEKNPTNLSSLFDNVWKFFLREENKIKQFCIFANSGWDFFSHKLLKTSFSFFLSFFEKKEWKRAMKVAVLYPFHVWSKIKGGEINKEMKTNLKDSKLQTNRQRSSFKQTQL